MKLGAIVAAPASRPVPASRPPGWVALLAACVFAWTGLAAGEAGKPVEVRGRLVCLAEEMHKDFGADLPTGHQHLPGFKTAEKTYFSLLRTKLSEALFADPQLKERELQLTGRVYPGTLILDVTLMRSVRQGVVYDLYYWCDICAIKSVIPGECMCCQEHVVLKEVTMESGKK